MVKNDSPSPLAEKKTEGKNGKIIESLVQKNRNVDNSFEL